jgi:hypothetical protein
LIRATYFPSLVIAVLLEPNETFLEGQIDLSKGELMLRTAMYRELDQYRQRLRRPLSRRRVWQCPEIDTCKRRNI